MQRTFFRFFLYFTLIILPISHLSAETKKNAADIGEFPSPVQLIREVFHAWHYERPPGYQIKPFRINSEASAETSNETQSNSSALKLTNAEATLRYSNEAKVVFNDLFREANLIPLGRGQEVFFRGLRFLSLRFNSYKQLYLASTKPIQDRWDQSENPTLNELERMSNFHLVTSRYHKELLHLLHGLAITISNATEPGLVTLEMFYRLTDDLELSGEKARGMSLEVLLPLYYFLADQSGELQLENLPELQSIIENAGNALKGLRKSKSLQEQRKRVELLQATLRDAYLHTAQGAEPSSSKSAFYINRLAQLALHDCGSVMAN